MSRGHRATRAITISTHTLREIVAKRQTWFILTEATDDMPEYTRANTLIAHPLGLEELSKLPHVSELIGERVALVDPHPATLRADVKILGAVDLNYESTVYQSILSIHLINHKEFT